MPAEKDIRDTEAVRQEVNALTRLCQVESFFGFAVSSRLKRGSPPGRMVPVEGRRIA
jgi:hypothetical protein